MNNYIIDWIGPYHQGVAIFRSNGLYGVLLTGGNVLITPQYDYLASFNNGYAQAIRGGCCFVIDLSGKEYKTFGDSLVPLESKYDFVRDFKDGFACVKIDGKWGVIDTTGKVLFHPSYDYITDFEFGVAKCIKDVQRQGYANHWCILNKDGESFDFREYSEPVIGADGLISLSIYGTLSPGNDGRPISYGDGTHTTIRIDKKGHFALKNGADIVILDAKYNDYYIARDFSCGLSCVQKYDGYWGAIDTRGNIVVPFEYLSIGDFKESRSFAKDKNGTIVLLSEIGRIIKRLDDITDNESFSNGVAIVYKETSDGHWRYLHGSCGLINSKGDFILDFFEGEIIATGDPTIFTLKSNASKGSKDKQEKVGYFNSATGLLVKPQYDEIVRFEPDYVVVKALDISECKISFDGKPFVFNDDERVILPDWCIGGEDFQNGICKAQGANKKWGLVDKNGNTLCEPNYDFIGGINGEFVTTLGSRIVEKRDSSVWYGTKKETVATYGLVNIESGVAIPAKYDKVPEWNGCFYLVILDKLIGIIDAQGKVVSSPKYGSIEKFDKYFLYRQQIETREYHYAILFGLLNNKGKEVISPKYYAIELLKDDYFKGKTVDNKWCIFNESGQLSNRSYDEISIDASGLFRFKLANHEGWLDLNGNQIVHNEEGDIFNVPSKFEWCSDFKDGYALALISGFNNFVNEQFDVVVILNEKPVQPDIHIDCVIQKDFEGNIIYKHQGMMGLMSSNGKSIIPSEYNSIRYLSKNYYVVSKYFPYEDGWSNNSKFGVINVDGVIILPFEYNIIAPFYGTTKRHKGEHIIENNSESEELKAEFWYVSKSGYYGLIDLSGKLLLEAKYEIIQQTPFGFFMGISERWIVYDKTFSPVGDGEYYTYGIRDDGYYTVTNIESGVILFGILNPEGIEKIAPKYKEIGTFNSRRLPEGLAIIVAPEFPYLYGIINKNYDILLEPQFSQINDFKDGECITYKTVNGVTIRGSIDVNGEYSDLGALSANNDKKSEVLSQFQIAPETIAEEEIEIVSQLWNGLTIIKTVEDDYSESYYSIRDSSGRFLLPFKYHGITPFKNGHLLVSIKQMHGISRYGVINSNLEEIIKPVYYQIEESGVHYIVCDGSNYGVFDLNGTLVIPCKYGKIEKASEQLFWLYENEGSLYGPGSNKGEFGLANDKGEFIVSPRYIEIQQFKDGLACVKGGGYWDEDDDDHTWSYLGGHWGIIDETGNEIVPLIYDSISYDPSISCFRVSKSLSIQQKDSLHASIKSVFGCINKQGEKVIKSTDGNYIVASSVYEWQEDYIDGLSTVYYSGLTGHVNEQGQLILHYKKDGELKEALLPPQFDWGYDSETDCIVVVKDTKMGLYSIADERLLIETEYDSISPLGMHSNGSALYLVMNYSGGGHSRWNARHGLVKETGEILLSPEYSKIEPLGFSLFVITSNDGKSFLYDIESDRLLPDEFSHVFKFGERNDSYYWGEDRIIKDSKLAIVCSDNKYGAINRFGEIILPVEYPSLVLNDGDILVCNDMTFDSLGRTVVSNGSLTVPIKDCYKSATLLDTNLIVAKRDGYWGSINLSMREILPFIYESIDAHDRVFIVSRKNQDSGSLEYGVVDMQNNIIVPFSDVEEIVFEKGLFIIKKDDLYGAYSDKGILICDASYEKLDGLNGFLIKVGRSDVEYDGGEDWYTERVVTRWGLINIAGEEVLPPNYKEIEEKGDSGFIQIKSYEYVGLLDATGKIVLEPKYYQISDFVDSYSIVLGPISVYNKKREVVEAKAYGVIDGV